MPPLFNCYLLPVESLLVLDSIEAKYNLGIDMSVVSYAYQAKKFSGGIYGLVGRKKRELFILNLELVHDRVWKNEFFFVEKASLVLIPIIFANVGGKFCYFLHAFVM